MKFDYNGDVPLFVQVATQIEEMIFNGSLQAGNQVPSTTEVSATYQLNPATVLKGMNLLVDRQIIEKRRGIGMFVMPFAVEKIKQEKQKEFLTNNLSTFILKAKQLNISKEELIQLIDGGYDK